MPSAVLIVDDEPQVARVVQMTLERAGLNAWIADSGKEAIEIYTRNPVAVALVLMDVQMPDMDGVQTLSELRKVKPEVRCCFMSGSTGKYSDVDLLHAGATLVLNKPAFLSSVGQVATIFVELFKAAKEAERQRQCPKPDE